VTGARDGERLKTWTDLSGNAFPTTISYSVSGLEEGVRYKVKVRARNLDDEFAAQIDNLIQKLEEE